MLTEARSELMKQDCKVDSLETCIRELQRQTHSQQLELDGAHRGYEEPRREQVRLQEELVMREKALRDTRIRGTHEMEELRRVQELRVDEFSVQKLRESHDTIQKLTSQIQELQERVNCTCDSGEFQDIESNYSGKNSHVPSQPAAVPSPRSMSSRDRSMPFDTWNLSEPQGNVFGQSTLHHQGILHSTNPSVTGAIPVQVSTRRPVARGEERIGSTTPMPMSAGRPSTMNSFPPAEIPQNSMAVQQRLQIRFSLGGHVMDQRCGDGRFSG